MCWLLVNEADDGGRMRARQGDILLPDTLGLLRSLSTEGGPPPGAGRWSTKRMTEGG